MKEAMEYILKAVKELKKLECTCNSNETCKRCTTIIKLNAVHSFLAE